MTFRIILRLEMIESISENRVILGTFVEEVAKYKDEKYPDLMRGAYKKEVVDFYIASLLGKKDYEAKFNALQIPFNDLKEDSHVNVGTVSVINYAHEHNIAVMYWTINNEEDARYLMSIGADCVITDYPDMVYKIRETME